MGAAGRRQHNLDVLRHDERSEFADKDHAAALANTAAQCLRRSASSSNFQMWMSWWCQHRSGNIPRASWPARRTERRVADFGIKLDGLCHLADAKRRCASHKAPWRFLRWPVNGTTKHSLAWPRLGNRQHFLLGSLPKGHNRPGPAANTGALDYSGDCQCDRRLRSSIGGRKRWLMSRRSGRRL
jgi:hypothetical protein